MRTTVIGMISVILVGIGITPIFVQTEPARPSHDALVMPAMANTPCGHGSAAMRAAPKLVCGWETGAQIAQAQ